MPFYRWDDMKKRNIVSTTDSRGSMVLGDFTTLTRQEQPPGMATRPHSHDCEQIIHILEGVGWFRVGQEEKTLGTGDVVHIPLGVEHELRNPGRDVLVYLSFKNRRLAAERSAHIRCGWRMTRSAELNKISRGRKQP